MELNFIKCGDYYVPDIKLAKPNIRLGKWGRMRKEYLRLAHPILFSDMVLSETLYEHCAEIEEAATGNHHSAACKGIRRDGAVESRKPNRMGSPDERLRCTGRGNHQGRTDLLLRKELNFMILEALFNGEIYASENVVPKSDKFREATGEIARIMSFFEDKLSKEDYALLEKLCDSHADEGNITNEVQFKYGFTMGVLMMCEIFHSPFFPPTK